MLTMCVVVGLAQVEMSLSHVASTLWSLAVLDVPSKVSSSSPDSAPKRRKPKAGEEGGKLQQRAVEVWHQLIDMAVKILEERDSASPGNHHRAVGRAVL